MPYSEAQKRATAKFKKKAGIVKINLDVLEEKREQYKAQAAQKGMSLTSYIINLLEKDKENE
jgi:predicted DNA binding CopG/RHH family protein